MADDEGPFTATRLHDKTLLLLQDAVQVQVGNDKGQYHNDSYQDGPLLEALVA